MSTLPTAADPLGFLTFSPMIDSETCRFLLTRYQIPYREEPHIFAWVSVLALWRNGSVFIPLIQGEGYRFVGPDAIIARFENQVPADRKLVPADSALSAQVKADWNRFHGDLATATTVLAYFNLLPHRDIMVDTFTRGVPATEAAVVKVAYPLFAGLFRLLLRLSQSRADDALKQVRAIFDETDKRLADGRRFLVGQTLTLSEIGLAVATAPLLLPPNYGSPIPPFDQMPPVMQSIITELRQRETGKFVQRIYSEFRKGA
jgi:hypothetical protein